MKLAMDERTWRCTALSGDVVACSMRTMAPRLFCSGCHAFSAILSTPRYILFFFSPPH